MNELDAFRSVDFDWTRQLRSIWRDPPYNVPSLHQERLDDIVDYFGRKTRDPDNADEPLGCVVVGPAGYGKTHLMGELRRRVWRMNGWFVLLDFVGIKDFWQSGALGFLNSLQVQMGDGRTQYDWLILRLATRLGISHQLIDANRWRGQPRELVAELARLFVKSLAREHFREAVAYQDVVTALILLISDDLDCHSIAHAWLQGMNLDAETTAAFGFHGRNEPINVVQGLSWIMSLVGPTLIAIDQIDAIVSASNALSRAANGGAKEEQAEAQSIVESLAQGLMDLHEKKWRAVTVIACLEATWNVLQEQATVAVTARYNAPAILRALPSGELAAGLVTRRLARGYDAQGFKAPYPTWPFTRAAFETAVGFSPRQLLKACEAHRQHCVVRGAVLEATTFAAVEPGPTTPGPKAGSLDQHYEEQKAAASIARLMDADTEAHLQALLDFALRLFEKHLDLPDNIDVEVQKDPDQKRPSLHGRLTFTFHSEGDREQHYCFRILGHTNAIAFQSRLKAAMTASGIDRALQFRHLFVLRHGDPPGGARTTVLVDQFRKAGGKFVAPQDDDLRTFVALREMARRDLPSFESWLRTRKPLFETPLFNAAGLCPPPFLAPPSQDETAGSAFPRNGSDISSGTALRTATNGSANGASTEVLSSLDPSPTPEHDRGAAKDRTPGAMRAEGRNAISVERHPAPSIPIGRLFERGQPGGAVTLALDLLPRHIAILAGSGSGKTVLLRRIVEEALLRAIPSVVIDVNNDLTRLGDPWPQRPDGWGNEEVTRSAAYHARADVVIWTPGVLQANPLSLKLLPDFAAVGDKPDEESDNEREQAVELARATLAPYLGGTGQKASLRQGVLADALRAFARRGGGSLDDLIRLLSDLPADVSKISNAPALGGEIANQLLAAIATNPLLQSPGPSLDPQRLFYGEDNKTRVSVVSLAGLASEEARQTFVNQLQMTLFSWIKQNPTLTGRLYVLDEAQNFAPSQVATASKASALSLVAQARKYGLGMIFATQMPKGIDNAIVSNSTTHLYGRMSLSGSHPGHSRPDGRQRRRGG